MHQNNIQKGDFIVTTKKALTGSLITVIVGGVLMAILGIITMIVGKDAFNAISGGNGGIIGLVCGLFLICMPIVSLLMVLIKQSSYIAVYENCVEGATFARQKGSEKFILSYDEIVNITVAAKMVTIHTGYAQFECLCNANTDEVVSELRKRISKK